jgi:hypothetical protein
MKKKIKDTNSEMYLKLTDNNDIAKQNLDKFLEDKDKNKDTVRLTCDESINLFTEYCKEFGKVPPNKTKYKGSNLYMWYQDKKKKIKDTNSEMYLKLIDNNDIVKQDLDRYLDKKMKK